MHTAHLLAQIAYLATIVSEFFCGVFVAHGFNSLLRRFFGASLSTASWPGSCPVRHLTNPRTRPAPSSALRSEERRVGKECRSRGRPDVQQHNTTASHG